MPASNNPFGFIAVRSLGGGEVHTQTIGSRALGVNGIAAGDSTAIYIGQTVKLANTGVITAAAAGDTNTLGVFAGCEYDDVTNRHIVGYWPGTAGASNIVAWVWSDPRIVFQVQANATAAATNIGENFNLVTTTGSTATQRSNQALAISTTTTSAAQYQLIGFADRPDNATGDAFPILEVKLNINVEAASYSGV